MPGKVTSQNLTASRLERKSSPQNLDSRKSTSSSSLVFPDEGPTSALRSQLSDIFRDAQKTTVGHRKLVVGLRKTQETCAYEPLVVDGGSTEFGENEFNVEFARCVTRLMGVKKSESVGDRLVRFVGFFLRHASEKDAALIPEKEIEETQSFPETASARLTSYLLSMLLQFMTSKERTVRYRSTQLVSHIVNSLDSIDDDLYHLLKTSLLRRIKDKEPMIRGQAVLGLGRLAGNEEDGEQDNIDSDDEDDSSGLLEKLLEALQNDPNADVRRTLLLNLPLTPVTLPYLLERARDSDAATRRALYSRLLPALGDFRHLSLSMREKLLRWGLRDRDENVRKAAAKLFRERWIEDCAGPKVVGPDGKHSTEAAPPSINGLLELLERIDVVNSGVDDGIAAEAMKEFWEGRPDYQEEVSFIDPFWDNLSSEAAFMVRSFNDFCRAKGDPKYSALVEEKMPEVTKLAFYLERYANTLVEILQRTYMRGEGGGQEEPVEHEFIVEQLLHIAKTLDYSDEVGRRKMFALLRGILAIAELPDEITRLVIDVLRDLCGNEVSGEREFCSVVLEAVAEVHDALGYPEPKAANADESFHSAHSEVGDDSTPRNGPRDLAGDGNSVDDEEKAIREIMINMKCLHIAQCLLQNVDSNLQSNVTLVTMLNNLVVPAVRSHEAPIRERGLVCLGLCCLLDKNLADENLTLFLHCFNKGHEALQVTAIHILADILTTHPSLLSSPMADPNLQKQVLKVLGKAMKAKTISDVQAAATTALCKLMLTSAITDEDLLKTAVVLYFDPASGANPGVRQALTYFLPVYCYSRRENMERMANIAGSVIHAVVALADETNEGNETVGIGVTGNMLVDWTDARKLIVPSEVVVGWDEAGKRQVKAVNGDVHLALAESLLERLLSQGCTREDKKALTAVLGKLYITANSSLERLGSVNGLVTEAINAKVASEAASRTALNKLRLAVDKALGEASKGSRIDVGEVVEPEAAREGGVIDTTRVNGFFEATDVAEKAVMPEEVDDAAQAEENSMLDELLDEANVQ